MNCPRLNTQLAILTVDARSVWAMGHMLEGGFIPEGLLYIVTSGLSKRKAAAAVTQLIDCGAWQAVAGGWMDAVGETTQSNADRKKEYDRQYAAQRRAERLNNDSKTTQTTTNNDAAAKGEGVNSSSALDNPPIPKDDKPLETNALDTSKTQQTFFSNDVIQPKEPPKPVQVPAQNRAKTERKPNPKASLSATVLPPKLDTTESREALAEWIQFRKERKPEATQRSIDKVVKKYANRPADLIAAIDHTIEMGWQGLRMPDGPAGQRQNPNVSPLGMYADPTGNIARLQEMMEDIDDDIDAL